MLIAGKMLETSQGAVNVVLANKTSNRRTVAAATATTILLITVPTY